MEGWTKALVSLTRNGDRVAVRAPNPSVRQICREMELSRKMVRNRLDRLRSEVEDLSEHNIRVWVETQMDISLRRGRPPILSIVEEVSLVEFCKMWVKSLLPLVGCGLHGGLLDKFLCDLCEKKGLPVGSGKHLRKSFLQRWPELTMVCPKTLNMARWKATTPANVKRYFRYVNEAMFPSGTRRGYRFIISVDETLLTGGSLSVSEKKRCYVSMKGREVVECHGQFSDHTTLVAFAELFGHKIDPVLIFQSPADSPRLPCAMATAPLKFSATCTESGFMNSALWFNLLNTHIPSFFPGGLGLDSSGAGLPHQILVICDNPKSHALNTVQLDTLQRKGIDYLPLPHSTSHKLQACDQFIFSTLKREWKNTIAAYFGQQNMYKGTAPSRGLIPDLLSEPYRKCMAESVVQSSFKAVGIVSTNLAEQQKAQEVCLEGINTWRNGYMSKKLERRKRAVDKGVHNIQGVACIANKVVRTITVCADKWLLDQEARGLRIRHTKKRMRRGPQIGIGGGVINSREMLDMLQERDTRQVAQEEQRKKEREAKVAAARKTYLLCYNRSTMALEDLARRLLVRGEAEKDHGKNNVIYKTCMSRVKQCRSACILPKRALSLAVRRLKAAEKKKRRKRKTPIYVDDPAGDISWMQRAKSKRAKIKSNGAPKGQNNLSLTRDQAGQQELCLYLWNGHSCNVQPHFLDAVGQTIKKQLHTHIEKLRPVLQRSYVWEFVIDNLNVAIFMAVVSGVLHTTPDQGRQCLLRDDLPEISEELHTGLCGTYLYRDKVKGVWIRSGKTIGVSRDIVRRTKEHRNNATKERGPSSRFYDLYGDRWDDLSAHPGICWKERYSSSLTWHFHWSENVMLHLQSSIRHELLTSAKEDFVAFILELVLDLAIAPSDRVSTSPGFEWALGCHVR